MPPLPRQPRSHLSTPYLGWIAFTELLIRSKVASRPHMSPCMMWLRDIQVCTSQAMLSKVWLAEGRVPGLPPGLNLGSSCRTRLETIICSLRRAMGKVRGTRGP